MASRKESKPVVANGQNQENPEYPFRILFSDGQAWEDSKINKHHERLPDQDPRCDPWKDKLGSMLGRQLFPKDERIFYLESLPSNYHLRLKSNGKDGRQDLYLYGYPGDKNTVAKSFKSPAEFFPHLLWLARGGERKREDCSCCLCNPSGKPRSMSTPSAPSAPSAPAVPAAPAAPAAPPVPDPSVSGLPMGVAASPATGMSNSPKILAKDTASPVPSTNIKTIPAPSRASLHSATNPTQSNGTSIPPPAVSNQQSIAPAPQSTASTSSRAVSRSPVNHDTLFRGGEVVWYKNNFAWRLGIITHTDITGMAIMKPVKYVLIPLAHNKFHVEYVEKPETDMRPFLAFSVPQLNKSVSDLNGQRMSQINWDAVQLQLAQNDPQKMEMLALEASKLAATLIDHSYSTFNLLGRLPPDAEAFEGVFLGAEKIYVGEAVRLLIPPEEQNPQLNNSMPVVMVVKQIWVKTQNGEVAQLYFSGDVWRLQESNLQQSGPDPQQLPVAMQREKAFRDDIVRSRGIRFDWVLVAEKVTKEQHTVRGRFYETRRLAPILNPETFQHSLAQGDVADLQALLNNRGDSNGPYIGRTANRADTVAGAISDACLAAVENAT
ncbi:hypothetical protein F5X99DRAFT_87828 [Biscogniauxia marginata]|nr:hypothetical protein F5X99DRAFT_87828 [Biscogniauxia marginata]